jgi:2-haloacid dehalogenase
MHGSRRSLSGLGEAHPSDRIDPMSHPLTAVVFDLGNVLIDWDPQPAIAAGVGPAEAERFLAAEDLRFSIWNQQLDRGVPGADAEAAVARDFPHWRSHVAAYREHFPLALRGAIESSVRVLEELYQSGVDLYALTNWSAELFPVARARFEFLQLFDDIVVSGEEGLAKPDPALFEVLRRRTGRPLGECVLIDDLLANVEAARAVGMDAIVFTDAAQLRQDLSARGLL